MTQVLNALCHPDDIGQHCKSSGWQTAVSLSHPDEIRPGANSSGYLRVWTALCHPDDIVQHHKSSGWHPALTKSHPDDLLKLRCLLNTPYIAVIIFTVRALFCFSVNGGFYPYPSGLLNRRWTIIRLPNSRDANVNNVGKETMWICRTL